MSAIQTTIHVAADGRISGQAPAGVPPGEHTIEIPSPETSAKTPAKSFPPFPVLPADQCGPWLADLSLRREDLYGDDGR